MTLPVQRMIKSICSKQLSLISKRTIHQEAKHPTIDALGQTKKRRHEYLGHILRLDPSCLLHRFIVEIPPLHKQGSLTPEVPFRTLTKWKQQQKIEMGGGSCRRETKEQMLGSRVPLWGQHGQGSKVAVKIGDAPMISRWWVGDESVKIDNHDASMMSWWWISDESVMSWWKSMMSRWLVGVNRWCVVEELVLGRWWVGVYSDDSVMSQW